MPAVLLSARAERDMRRLGALERERIQRALRALSLGAPNLDIRALEGCSPWRRLRVGDWRVLFRRTAGDGGPGDHLRVARIVNRRDLEAATRGLDNV